jgi:FkbM family methyltransferase
MFKLSKKIISKFPIKFKLILLDILDNKFVRKRVKNLNETILGVPYKFSLIDDNLCSLIYFGIWESAEISLSLKYLKYETMIIECGASLGVVASNILFEYPQINYVAIEGNPISYKILNLQILNKGFTPINELINYPDGMINFDCSSVLGASIEGIKHKKESAEIISIYGRSLTKILEKNNILVNKSSFSLILDVEGLEGLIFKHDSELIKKANYIICELEDTSLYSIEDQVKMLESLNFKIIENIDNVYAFVKKN